MITATTDLVEVREPLLPSLRQRLSLGKLGLSGGCVLAVAGVALVAVFKVLLDPLIEMPIPFLLFFGVVLLAAGLGGLVPGLLAALLATLAAVYLFVPPAYTMLKSDWGSYLAAALFLLEAGFVSRLTDSLLRERLALKASEQRLRASEERWHRLNQDLEQRVRARTTELEQTNAELREREARLQALLSSGGAVITIDEQGLIESVNAAAEQLLGWNAAELVGSNIGTMVPSPYREEHGTYLSNYRRTGVRRIIGTTQEVLVRHRNGSTIPVELTVAEATGGPRRLFTGVLRDIRKRRALEREVLEIASKEQHRLGQELHDSVGQELTGLTLLADVLVHRLERTAPEQLQLAERISARLQKVHEDVRILARGLIPVHVDAEGLQAALEDLAARTDEQTAVRCTFATDEHVSLADGETAIHLYRIAQEAVSNALRHSQARNIFVTLRTTPTAVVLGIRDDGIGMAGDRDGPSGLGVRTMQYRAGVIGGTLQVRPAAGGGTLVTCTLSRRTSDDPA